MCASKNGYSGNLVLEHDKQKTNHHNKELASAANLLLNWVFIGSSINAGSKIITKTLRKRNLCSWFLSLQYCHHSSKQQAWFWFWDKFIQWVHSFSKARSSCKVMNSWSHKGQLHHPEEEGAKTEPSIHSPNPTICWIYQVLVKLQQYFLYSNFNIPHWLKGLCLSMTIGFTSVNTQADLTGKRIVLNLWQASKEICRADSMDVNTRGLFLKLVLIGKKKKNKQPNPEEKRQNREENNLLC